MIDLLRKRLKKRGQSLVWFHDNYIKNICKYSYFIRQINIPDCLQDNVKQAIQKYLDEV